jgi:uncharacterized protein
MFALKQTRIGLVATLLILGGLLVAFVRTDQETDLIGSARGTITVIGRGQAVGQPDIAHALVEVSTSAKTLQEAAARNEDIIQAIMQVLVAGGVAVGDAQEYITWIFGENRLTTISRYSVANQIRITIRDLSKIENLLAAVMNAGANHIFGFTFSVADLAALEAEARTKAMIDARARAMHLAELSNIEVGEIKMVSEVFNPPPVPFLEFGGRQMVLEHPAAVSSVASGQMIYEVQMQVTFNIK